ncbi:MAG: class I SAM-dependent methyltransferase [Pseudomonadota bacterium]
MDPEASTDRSERFLDEAYGLKDLKDVMGFYHDWAEDYDDQMEQKLGYIAPRVMAERLAAHLENKAAAILDVGCGTGLTSKYLADSGFAVFDGVDITPRMLERSRERGIYRALIEADITLPLEFADASYDAVISSGTFTLGHVGSEPIAELVRVLKPGGHLACSIHKEIWTAKGFEQKFDALAGEGVLREVERTPGEFFKGYGETALYFVFEKI